MSTVNKLITRFVIVSFMMTSCIFPHDDENRHSVIEMNNHSDKAIYVNIDAEYPDTSGRFIGDANPRFKISSHNKNFDILHMPYGNTTKPYQVTALSPTGEAVPIRDQQVSYTSFQCPI